MNPSTSRQICRVALSPLDEFRSAKPEGHGTKVKYGQDRRPFEGGSSAAF